MRRYVISRHRFVPSTVTGNEPYHQTRLIQEQSRAVWTDAVRSCSILAVDSNYLRLWQNRLNLLLHSIRIQLRILKVHTWSSSLYCSSIFSTYSSNSCGLSLYWRYMHKATSRVMPQSISLAISLFMLSPPSAEIFAKKRPAHEVVNRYLYGSFAVFYGYTL